jgi:hypothetical protein
VSETTKKVGILLLDIGTGEQIGMVGFDRSGLLVFSVIASGLHFNALKSVEGFFKARGMAEPLYVKYADRLDESKELPLALVEQEADHYAELVNQANPPLKVGAHLVKASIVHTG